MSPIVYFDKRLQKKQCVMAFPFSQQQVRSGETVEYC